MALPALDLRPHDTTRRERAPARRSVTSYAPFLAAAVALVAGLVAVNALPVGGFYDDAFYVILAKSLATGQGYRNLNLPGVPVATHYPPGYPAFLALLWRIGPGFPANLVLFKVANAAFLAVAAAFAYKLGRERFGLGVAAALIATTAGTATTPALYLSSMVLSETMFLALAIPFLLWAEREVMRTDDGIRRSLVLGICTGLLFLVRSQAIALIGALAVVYALRRRWRESALVIGGAVMVIAPWLVWVSVHGVATPPLMRGDYGSYFAWFADGLRERGLALIADTVRRNVPDMLEHVARRLRPPTNPLPDIVSALGVLTFAILGAVRLARRAPVTLAFLGGYLAIVAVWPFAPVRFLLGIWVLLMLLIAAGAQSLLETPPNARAPKVRRTVGALVSIALVIGLVAYNVRGYQRHWWATTEELSARWIAPKLAWVKANTDTSAVIATDHDEGTVYLYTGRRSVPITTFTAAEYLDPRDARADAAVLRSLATHFQANYLTLSSVRMRAAAAAMSVSGVPLGDGTHKAVPWAFTLRPR
jgi:hypothetical protein